MTSQSLQRMKQLSHFRKLKVCLCVFGNNFNLNSCINKINPLGPIDKFASNICMRLRPNDADLRQDELSLRLAAKNGGMVRTFHSTPSSHLAIISDSRYLFWSIKHQMFCEVMHHFGV